LDDTLIVGSTALLTDHTVTPGPGDAWINPSTEKISVYTTGAYPPTAANSFAYNDVATVTDVTVTTNGKVGNASSVIQFGSCRLDGSLNGYCAVLIGAGSTYNLKITEGTPSYLGGSTTCTGFSINTYYDVQLVISGTTITSIVYEEGSELCRKENTGESTFASGKPGMVIYSTAPRVTSITAE